MTTSELASTMKLLNNNQIVMLISSKELSVSQASQALIEAGISREERIQILTKAGLITATEGQTAANVGLTASLKGVTAGLWATTKAFLASPLGMAVAAIAGIFAIVKIVDAFTVSLEESRKNLANLKQEFADNENELQSLNGELETTIDRIDELQAKDSLTFTEKEELNNLQKQNAELQRQIDLLETEQKIKNKELNKSFVQTMEKETNNVSLGEAIKNGLANYGNTGEPIVAYRTTQDIINEKFADYKNNLAKIAELDKQYKDDLANKSYQNERARIEESNDKILSYLYEQNDQFKENSENISYIPNPTTEDEKKVNEWLDYIGDYQDKIAILAGGTNAKTNAFNRIIDNKFSDTTQNLKELGKQGKVTAKELQNEKYKDFIQNLINVGIISDDSTDSLNLIALAFNGTSSAVEGAANEVENATDKISQSDARIATSSKEVEAAITSLSKAQSILQSQSTGSSISVEDYNSEELADYTSALEYHNGVLQLNAEKVRELAKAKVENEIASINEYKAQDQNTYLKNASEIEKLRQKIKDKNFAEGESEKSIQNSINALLDENSAIKSNCDAYDLMTASLQEATDKYHNWLNAQNAAQSGDMFDDTLNAINRINETLNNVDSEYYGRVGRTDYQAAINLIIPDTVNPEDEAKVNAYLKSIYDMFTYDDDGNRAGLNIENFCQKAVDKGLMVFDKATETYQIAGQKTMEDFAEGMNMTLPLVQAMFGEMEEFGGEFSWADEAVKTIGDLGVTATESAEALRQIKGNEDLAIKLDVSEIEGTDEKISTLESTIKTMQEVKGKANVDASEIEYANQIIEYCIAQKQNLSSPIVMSVDTTAISEKNAEIIGKIQEFKRACNDLELKQSLGVDTKDAEAKVNSLAGELKNIDANILAELNLDPTSIETLKTSINGITGEQLVKIGIDDNAIVGWSPENKTATVTYKKDTTEIDQYNPDNLERKVTYHIASEDVDKYNPKNLTRTVTYNIKTKGGAGGGVDINGTAHAFGTAYANGNWSTKQGGDTLVGELGREIVVDPHTGRWYTVGDRGAEFVSIPKGAIVFNHKQTESLLANGYVAGRASALVNGTAMVTGGIKRNNAQTSTKSGGNSTSNYRKSSSSSSKSSSKSSNKEDKEPQIFDWIEVALSRIQRTISNLSKKAESTFKKLSTRLKATNDEISNVNKEINLQQKAADRYMKEANGVGLSSGLAKQVREGTININEYSEETQKLIQDYQKWYEKSLECKDAIADLHEELASLYEDNFNNVKDDYENQLSLYEHLTNTYETGIDLLDAKGYMASTKYYSAMQDVEKTNIAIRKKELADLEKQFSAAMNSGEIEKYSEAWYSMQNEINGVKEAIAESEVNIAEFAKTMREIEWERFDYIQDRISQITQEADFLIDLMSSKELYDDKGQLNDEGMATMGLHGQNYNVYMAQADQYAEELLSISKDLAKDPYNTELIARREELLGLQQDSIKAAEAEKQAIVDMVEEGINRELESLRNLIDTYTDALDSAKDLYDYQKKIADKTSNIATLEKQLSAYEGDTSEEAKATIQKWQVDLANAKEDLEETEYEKYITDRKKLLDELYTEYESILNQRLDDVDALIGDMITSINANSDTINTTLESIAGDVGYEMSEQMQSIWNSQIKDTLSIYNTGFSDKLTSVNSTLNSIQVLVASMVKESDKKAKEKISSEKKETPPKANTSSTKSTSTKTKSPTSTSKKVTIGGKINASGAKIYADSYGGGKQNQYAPYAKDPIYTVIGENNGYWKVRYHKLSSGVTGWFKKGDVKAYKTGGLVDYTGLAQLDGTPGKPELVLNSNDTKNFIELRDILREMALQPLTIGQSYSGYAPSFSGVTDISGKLATMSGAIGNVGTTYGDFNITIPIDHVEDYNDFVTKLQRDPKFENMILSMTVDRSMGKNSLAKYKYQWKR